MALAAATITALIRRWGEVPLARMTQREEYDEDTNCDIEKNVLERAVLQAQFFVRQVYDSVDESHAAVIETTPYYLFVPGGAPQPIQDAHDAVMKRMLPKSMSACGTQVAKGEDGDHRRYDGADYLDDLNVQAPDRPRRSGR